MRKFLYSMVAAFVAVLGFASTPDTLFFAPGEAGNCPLKLDTVKYPYLTEENVTWMAGFPEVTTKFDTEEGQQTATVCAMRIEPSMIVTVDGVKYLHSESVPENWFNVDFEGAPKPRTITIFNAHTIAGTRSITDVYGTFYTKEDLATSILDTVAVLHISKELDGDDFTFGYSGKGNTYRVGDTVEVSVSRAADVLELDIQNFALASIDGKDTTILAVSDSSKIIYVTDEELNNVNVQVIAYNNRGYVASDTKRKLTVLPTFRITSLVYGISRGNSTYILEGEAPSIEVPALKGDSLTLTLNTNVKEGDYSVQYSWNKDGNALPDSILLLGNVNNKLKCNTLSFPKVSDVLFGTYNCIVVDSETKEVLGEASFIVTNANPTANESIAPNTKIKILGDRIEANGTGDLIIYNALGKFIKMEYVNRQKQISISNLEKGIYFITFDGVKSKFSK